jgi:hypothetical protein
VSRSYSSAAACGQASASVRFPKTLVRGSRILVKGRRDALRQIVHDPFVTGDAGLTGLHRRVHGHGSRLWLRFRSLRGLAL